MNRFSQTLQVLLAERGLSQAALARRLGLSPQAVSSWANGDTVPSHENAVRLEDELAVEPRGSLLKLAGYSPDHDEQPTVESLVRADPGLDAEDKRVILRIIALARARHTEP